MSSATSVIAVRRAVPSDSKSIIALLVDLPNVYPGADLWIDRTLDEVFAGKASCTLACVDGAIVGIVIDKPKPDGRRKLSTLYVDPGARGRGIARAIMDEAQRRWWTEGVVEVYVTCRIPRNDALTECLVMRGFVAGAILPNRYGQGHNEQIFVWRPSRRAAIFSLWSRYAEAIWSGEKRFEFRRRRIGITSGDRILVYETAPISSVTGEFIAGAIIAGIPGEVRRRAGAGAGPGLDEYFAGAEIASGIRIVAPMHYVRPKPLSDFGLAHPPLSYTFLRTE